MEVNTFRTIMDSVRQRICYWIKILIKYIDYLYVNLPRYLRAGFNLFKFRLFMSWTIWNNKVFLKFFDQNVPKYHNKTAIIYHLKRITFESLAKQSNKVSNWLESLQLRCDDQLERIRKIRQPSIGLMFENCPELISFLIGVARVRCSSVMFNTNHRQDLLLNAFEAVECDVFIFEAKFLVIIQEIADRLPEHIQMFVYDRELGNANHANTIEPDPEFKGMTAKDLVNSKNTKELLEKQKLFVKILQSYPDTSVAHKYQYKMNDVIFYVFTSGTTGGKIKAAAINNIRLLTTSFSCWYMLGITDADNVYVCTPLYHSMGTMGVSMVLALGTTMTLADKFSATNFWKDCYENGCTVSETHGMFSGSIRNSNICNHWTQGALYIGELCRFLLSKPSSGYERKHQIEWMLGGGLNKTIWNEFKQRFNIKRIIEFYSSSEGNAHSVNLSEVPGSCGFVPYGIDFIARYIYPIQLLKIDPKTNELIRGQDGLCKMAEPDEIGLLVGIILENDSLSQFSGYSSKEESAKKIIKNVRRHGDSAFVSGDLFKMDHYGNLFFKDRIGDTFRWKGENVSTIEIESVVQQFLKTSKFAVYGVEVPNADGRAGMVAIEQSQEDFDFNEFYDFIKSRVPEYAQPKFIRFTNQIQTTSTFKYMKYLLQKDGFDLAKMKPDDRLFYFDRKLKKYSSLDQHAFDQIYNGNIKF